MLTLVRFSLVWFGFFDLFGLVWFGLVFGLVWFGLVWFGLVWFGLVWFSLVWFGLVCLKQVFLLLIKNVTNETILFDWSKESWLVQKSLTGPKSLYMIVCTYYVFIYVMCLYMLYVCTCYAFTCLYVCTCQPLICHMTR